ncbi:MAG: translation elongation factor Ts [Fimbriimonadaceae bacterium]|nr:translation elongation factor Ts [Fimbriimonadaceae bacterium]
MEIDAKLVMKLRSETDAPVMECKAALTEAGGDYEKAKQILREKGKAAAAKRADRTTSAGVAMFVADAGNKNVGGVVLESETDFVAKNPDFIATAEMIAKAYVDQDPTADPLAIKAGDKTVGALVEESVAKIRENIKVAKAVHLSGSNVAVYVHHDKTKAAAVVLEGDSPNLMEAGQKLAIQCVASSPKYIEKEEVPADIIEKEIETETQRAVNEGKNADVAANIARGRVNKEFFQTQVLLEQPFYADNKKTVSQYLKEQGGTIKVVGFTRLAVGE